MRLLRICRSNYVGKGRSN